MTQSYEIVLVRRVAPPLGAEGTFWCRYVIAFEGTDTIHGSRQGGLKAVTKAVEEIVALMNERHLGHWSKPSHVDWALKKKTRK